MNRKFNFKEWFHWLVGIATIVSCVFTIIGVMKVVLLVVDVQPIVKEIQQNTILKLQRDTIKILVRDTITIIRRDTVSVERKAAPDDSFDPGVKREKRIRSAEDDFRRRHPEIFN
ncbi:MAG: hypothetical protein K2I32_08890 [Alistipes sp.]|nr:hypothetical protein [Alistipes sp.]